MVAPVPSPMFDIEKIKAAAYSVLVNGDRFVFGGSNRVCLDLVGMVRMVHHGLTPHDIFPQPVADEVVSRYRACVAGEAVSYVASIAGGAGTRGWRTTLFPILDDDGLVSTIIGICAPLGIEDKAALSLSRDDGLSALVLDVIDGGFWVLDIATQEFETTRRLTDLVAGPNHAPLTFAEYIGRIHADDLCLEMPEPGRDMSVEFRIFTYDGRMRWFQTRRRSLRDSDGHVTHVVGMVLDITEQKSRMKAREDVASVDTLTQVRNRRTFDRAADRSFDEDAGHASLGIVILDIDRLAGINESYGRRVGDEILRETAQRLDVALRTEDMLSRIGDDEFAILIRGASADALDKVIARIEAAMDAPFGIDGRSLHVALSYGTAMRRASDRAVGEVMERADAALHAMKKERRRLTA